MVKARGVVQGVSRSAVGTNVTSPGVTPAGMPGMFPVGFVRSVGPDDEVAVELSDSLRPALLDGRVLLRCLGAKGAQLYVTEVARGTAGVLRPVDDEATAGDAGEREDVAAVSAGVDAMRAMPRRVHVWKNLPPLPPATYYCDLRSADGAPVRLVRTESAPSALRWRARVFLRGAVTGALAQYSEVDMGTLSDDAGVPGLEVDGVGGRWPLSRPRTRPPLSRPPPLSPCPPP